MLVLTHGLVTNKENLADISREVFLKLANSLPDTENI
jgi:hypothetical protein